MGVWVYLNSLRGPFIVDDLYTIAWNFPLRNLSQIGKIAQQNLFVGLGIDSSYFRPLTQLSFALDFYVWGLNPVGFRLTGLALHLANAVLIFFLFRTFLSPSRSALVSLIFVVHPVNTQAIAYISSRSDPLFFFFTALTIYLWVTDKSTLRPFCLLFFLLGLLSKEPAVVTLPLILLTDLTRCESRNEIEGRLRSNWHWYIAFAGVLGAYLVLRLWVLDYPLLMKTELTGLTIPHRLFLASTLLGKHFVLLFFPLNLAFVHVVSLTLDPFAPLVLGPLLALIGLTYLALRLWKRERAIALGLGWFIISIFPALNFSPLNLPLMESWLYLPGVGLFIMMVSLGGLLVKPKGLRLFAACVIVFLLTMRSIVRSADWGNPVRLFEKNVQLYPGSDIAWSALAQAYSGTGREKESLEAIKRATEIRPDKWTSHYSLGLNYFLSDEDDKAEQAFLQAIVQHPDIAWPHYALGISYFRSGLWEKAREEFMKADRSKLHIPMLYHVIGSTYLALDKKELAEQAFQNALKEFPGKRKYHAGIHDGLGGLLIRKKRLEDAKREFNLALRFDPENKEAKEKLASLK